MKLTFVTLNTGNVLQYDRSKASEAAIEKVNSMLQGGGKLINGWSVTINHTDGEAAMFDLNLDDTPVSHNWLCLADTRADAVWHQATVESKLPLIVATKPATTPWLAVGMALTIGEIVTTRPTRLLEAAEIELYVAWVLAERS